MRYHRVAPRIPVILDIVLVALYTMFQTLPRSPGDTFVLVYESPRARGHRLHHPLLSIQLSISHHPSLLVIAMLYSPRPDDCCRSITILSRRLMGSFRYISIAPLHVTEQLILLELAPSR